MKTYKLVSQSGAWYTYVDVETDEEIKFQAKNFEEILKFRVSIKILRQKTSMKFFGYALMVSITFCGCEKQGKTRGKFI
jgi:hypothetical protein